MKNQLIYITLILLLNISCQNKRTHYDLIIHSKGNEEIKKMYLMKEIGATVDSTESENGIFKFSGELEEPQLCAVYSNKNPNQRKLFILDYGETKITIEPSSLSESEITFEFDNNNDLRKHFQTQFLEYDYYNRTVIFPGLQKARRKNDTEQINFFVSKSDSSALDMRKKIYEFVDSNAGSHGMAEVIYEELIIRSYLKPEEFLKVYNLYTEKIKQSFYGKKLKEYIDDKIDPPLKVGDKIIDFTMQDIHGNVVSIGEFRGKYVLIDFWASWCSPCRADNPNLVKAYKIFNPEGFEIVGVSLDTDKNAWLKAIEKDKLSWTNLSDLKGWKNELVQHYKITGVPRNMLLDRDGQIIKLDIHGSKLLESLHKIFNK